MLSNRNRSLRFHTVIFLLLQLFLIPFFTNNQTTFEKIHQQLVAFYDIGYYSDALILLAEMKEHQPKLYILNNYAYLEGRIHQKLINYNEAISAYQSLLDNNSILSDYAEFHLSEVYAKLEDSTKRKRHLENIMNSYHSSLLRSETYLQLAELYRRSKNYNRALDLYNRLFKEGKADYKYNAIFLAGKLYQENNMPNSALKKYYKLLEINPYADIALRAAEEIEKVEKKLRYSKLSEKEMWLRLRVYYRNREFKKAIQFGKRLINRFPTSRWADNSYYYLGSVYQRQQNIKVAKKYFQQLNKRYPKSTLRAACYLRLGIIELTEGDEKTAISYFSTLLNQYPNSRWAEVSLVELLKCYHQIGETSKGLSLIKSKVKSNTNSIFMADALLQAAKICWQDGEIDTSISYFDLLINGDFGSDKMAEAIYWKAKLYQQSGKPDKAVECYKKLFLLQPNNYYSLRARQQLLNQPKLVKLIKVEKLYAEGKRYFLQGNFAVAKDLFIQCIYFSADENICQRSNIMLDLCYSQLEEYNKIVFLEVNKPRELITDERINTEKSTYNAADEFLFLHIYDEAIAELSRELSKKSADFHDLYSLAILSQKSNLYSKSIAYAEKITSRLPQDYCFFAMDEKLKALLYPIYYYEEINKYAQQRGLDELFLAAVIREESRFNNLAKSSASARGLMQIIPSTAERLSRIVGERNFKVADLYNAEYSINIGSKYLQLLLKEFNGNYLASLAAYNAGEFNAHRWLKNNKNKNPDHLVLDIGFRETKGYVKRVMSSYWKYHLLFSTNNQEALKLAVRTKPF